MDLENFGFRIERGGAHGARSMMLNELETLLAYVDLPGATQSNYRNAIVSENCLGKRSVKSRTLTFRHLVELYALDPSVPLFHALYFLWARDPAGHPLLAFLCAYARDEILRAGAPYILRQYEGAQMSREGLEEYLETQYPDRFSRATLKSTAQNINTTMTRAGLLNGRVKKVRAQPAATPGSAVYALMLGHLRGVRGELLLETEYAKLLACGPERIVELAEEAARRGWITFRRIGRVMEVHFPRLLGDRVEAEAV